VFKTPYARSQKRELLNHFQNALLNKKTALKTSPFAQWEYGQPFLDRTPHVDPHKKQNGKTYKENEDPEFLPCFTPKINEKNKRKKT